MSALKRVFRFDAGKIPYRAIVIAIWRSGRPQSSLRDPQ